MIKVTTSNDSVILEANDTKKIIALILKRQRQKNNLRLEEVAKHLHARSINEYAQYEQGRHLPSIDPKITLFMSLK